MKKFKHFKAANILISHTKIMPESLPKPVVKLNDADFRSKNFTWKRFCFLHVTGVPFRTVLLQIS